MNLSPPKNSPAPPAPPRRTAKPGRSPGGRRSKCGAPMTPLLRWKLEDRHGSRGRGRLQFPARKLAAGLWQLHYREISGGEVLKRGTPSRRGPQGEGRHRRGDQSRNGGGVEEAEQRLQLQLQRRRCFDSSNNGIQTKAAATKWNSKTPEAAEAAALDRLYSHRKLGGGEQPFTAASAVSDLKAELALAQTRIRKLESRQRNSKKKVEHLKGKLEAARTLWRSRRHQKLGVAIDELDHERKTRHRTETLNASLTKELAEAKACVRQYRKEYEKEKKSRELMEEVCTELAKQIVEDKAKVEALKRESMKLCEELEEERNMLQMAEVWREERIQMKLIDAKLAMEDKYVQMNKLITDLENFLMSRSEKLDVMELKRAELIHQAGKSLNIEDIEGFFYEPQTQNLVLSLLEDLQEASKLEERCAAENNSVENKCVSESKTESVENPCGESRKKKIVDESSGRFSNRTVSSEGGEVKGSDSVSQIRNSQQNPHIRRGTHGCIEWPRGIQKNCFKTKSLDARIQSQKSQLRHVLKHKLN